MIASSRDRDAIVSRAHCPRGPDGVLWPIIPPPPLSYAATLTESLVRS